MEEMKTETNRQASEDQAWIEDKGWQRGGD